MITRNICRFVPKHKDYGSIQTINFVLETRKKEYRPPKSRAVYIMHYVLEGKGIFHTKNSQYDLSPGDVFFSLPAVPHTIESVENFKYMYISFLGTRANMIMDKLKINAENFIFHGLENLHNMWMDSIDINIETSDLRVESILLYTFSCIDFSTNNEPGEQKTAIAASTIKKFIDNNITDTDLSLTKISKGTLYNKTYISSVYKEKYKMGISKYITTARVQAACTLMEQGYTNIADIAFLCGFNDPLYFSKVFKQQLGVSPRKHIEDIALNLKK